MRRKFIITLLTALFILQGMVATTVLAANSQSLEAIQSERKEIQENVSVHEENLNELYKDIHALDEEVGRLESLLEEKELKVEEITYKIETTIEEIATIQEEIEQLNVSIEERFELLKMRAVSYQTTGGLINYIGVLFGSKSFGDFISRLTAVNQIMDSDASLMEQLEEEMTLVEEHQATTVEKLNELNEMHEEQEKERARLKEEKKEQESSKQALQEKKNELTAYVEELELEDKELRAMEENIKKEIAERREREERRIARKQIEDKKSQKSDLVQVAKVEPKTGSSQTSSSSKNVSTSDKNIPENTSSKSFTATATAYTANCSGCSGVTSTGINLNHADSSTKVIAVDPSVIPLGSIVKVEGYGYAIAGDTGGSIRGNKIDVFVPTESAARSWGIRNVKVTIQ